MDELEIEMNERLVVIRVNVQEEVGRELAPVYEFSFTPTFIFFNAAGDELGRQVGGLDTQRVRDSVK